MEQELLTLPKHPSTSPVFSGVRVTRSLVLCVCFVDRCLSVLLRFNDSDYPFSIFKLCLLCLFRFRFMFHEYCTFVFIEIYVSRVLYIRIYVSRVLYICIYVSRVLYMCIYVSRVLYMCIYVSRVLYICIYVSRVLYICIY